MSTTEKRNLTPYSMDIKSAVAFTGLSRTYIFHLIRVGVLPAIEPYTSLKAVPERSPRRKKVVLRTADLIKLIDRNVVDRVSIEEV